MDMTEIDQMAKENGKFPLSDLYCSRNLKQKATLKPILKSSHELHELPPFDNLFGPVQ
jgi:hypothetical protein